VRRGSGLAVHGLAQRDDPGGDRLVLRRILRQQIERLAPGGQGSARVARLHPALGVRGQTLQLVGVDEAMTGGTGEQDGRDLRAALRAGRGRPLRPLVSLGRWRDRVP